MNNKNVTIPVPDDACQVQKWMLALPVLFLVASTTILAIILNNFISFFAEELDAVSSIATITLIYNLSVAASAPIGARLGDIYGRKKMAVITLLFEIIGAVMAAFSTNLIAFLIALVVWGAANGFDETYYNGIICDLFHVKDRIRFLAISNSFNAAAVIIGGVVFGYFIDKMGTKNALLAAAGLLFLSWLFLMLRCPDIKPDCTDKSLDWFGSVFAPLVIVPFCVVLSTGGNQIPWGSPLVPILILVSFASAVLLYKGEKKIENPIIDFRLFKLKYFLPVIVLMAFNKLQAPITTYIMIYGNFTLHYSAAQVGSTQILTLIPFFVSPIIGRWLARTQKFKLSFTIFSVLLTLQCVLMFLFVRPEMNYLTFLLLRGIGNVASVFVMGPSIAYIGIITPEKERGIGIGLYTSLTYLANTVFTSGGGLLYNAFNADISIAFPYIVLICGVISVGAFFVARLCIGNPKIEN